jgi:DNA polymerase III delta prime subunit
MNEKIKTYLDRLAISKKRPSSFLFFGPNDEEKDEAAAYFISKLAGKAGDAEFARRIAEKIHPDVVVIEPEIVEDKKGRLREKEITIEQIREARKRLKFFPYELTKKFCVIKRSGKLNAESSNAILKILEEPTESAIFVLLANSVDSVLLTIASRCAILRFPQICLPGWSEENREKFRNIFKKEIFEKFDYIEKISKDKNELIGIFKDWEAVAAEGLRKLVMGIRDEMGGRGERRKIEKVVRLIGDLRETINQLERTNASARAAGEKLMFQM